MLILLNYPYFFKGFQESAEEADGLVLCLPQKTLHSRYGQEEIHERERRGKTRESTEVSGSIGKKLRSRQNKEKGVKCRVLSFSPLQNLALSNLKKGIIPGETHKE